MSAAPLSAAQQRYVAIEVAIGTLIAIAFSAAFTFAIFGGKAQVALWGTAGLAADTVPHTLGVLLPLVLVPTVITRRRLARGVVDALGTRPAWLPRRLLARALLLTLAGLLLGGGAMLVALKLLSGGSASLAAVDDLHQATGRDLNLVVGQKHNATVGGDMQERIEGLRKSVAGVSQRLVAPKNHIGSESVNLFRVVCDLLDLVQQMNTQLASHTHGPTPVPANAAVFTSNAGKATLVVGQLKPITL